MALRTDKVMHLLEAFSSVFVSYSYALVDKISTDVACCLIPVRYRSLLFKYCDVFRTRTLTSSTRAILKTMKNCTLLLMRTMNVMEMICVTCRLRTILNQLITPMM